MTQPEDKARENIDWMLANSGWAVRDQNDAHISAYRGLAMRNFTLKQGHGYHFRPAFHGYESQTCIVIRRAKGLLRGSQ